MARLVNALEYPTSHPRMSRRLETIPADDGYATLFACEGEDIVGLPGRGLARSTRATVTMARSWL
jgi:hypothetical protein